MPHPSHESLEALLGAIVASTRCSPLGEIADKAVRHACALLDAEGGSVTEVRGRQLHYIAGVGLASAYVGRVVDREGSFTGEVVDRREPRVFRVESGTSASRRRATSSQIACGLVAPIVYGDEVVGTLGVASSTPGRFDEKDLATIERMAGFVAGEVTRRIERIERERDLAWARFERLGAVLATGRLAPLGAARSALERAAARASDDPVVLDAVQQAIEAIDAATCSLCEARLGDPSDRAAFVEPDSRPVTLTPPRMPGLRTSRIEVRAECEAAAAFAHHALGRMATFEADLDVPGSLRFEGEPHALSSLVVDLLVDRLDHIPAGYRRRFGLELNARFVEPTHVTIEIRCPDLDPGTTSRGDADTDPFADTPHGSLARARAERTAARLGATLEVHAYGARVTLPVGSAQRGLDGQ